MRRLIATLVTLGLLSAGFFAWRDTTTVRLREVEIAAPGLARDVTILHVSDLHGARFGDGQADIGSLLGGRTFDAVVINGDHIPTFESPPDPALELLSVLATHAPTVAVTRGNHDTAGVLDALASAGAMHLGDGRPHAAIAPDAGTILLAPVRLEDALPDADVTVIVSHFPMTDDALREHVTGTSGLALYLFGHTHGGQMRLPLLGAVWAPGPVDAYGEAPRRHAAETFFPELRGMQVSGLAERAGAHVHISAGLGTQGVPVRLFCPAEVTAISLRASAE
jgi:predicted MPP superfamily phosphohydrolase